jgi:hypothetical protein
MVSFSGVAGSLEILEPRGARCRIYWWNCAIKFVLKELNGGNGENYIRRTSQFVLCTIYHYQSFCNFLSPLGFKIEHRKVKYFKIVLLG